VATGGKKKPLGPDQDGITLLPIDRSGTDKRAYGPTDPRNNRPVGGMRMGTDVPFVLDEAIPPLEPDRIGSACDNIVRGSQVYSSLLYLGRARFTDVPALLAASQSSEIRVRWERLWVLTPFLSRLSRLDAGREALLGGLMEDLPGVHLLCKFAEQNNPALTKMFKRLHDPLLRFLLRSMAEERDDPRQGSLIAGIVAVLEQKEKVIRRLLPEDLDPQSTQEVLDMLYTKPSVDYGSRLSPALLRDKLEGWRRG
jgi:hypothetical protein